MCAHADGRPRTSCDENEAVGVTESRIMRDRSFRPAIVGAALEPRISLSRVHAHPGAIPVIGYGSETNPGRFDGLVERKVPGGWSNAVFFNGHRYSEWTAHPGKPAPDGSPFLLKGDTLVSTPGVNGSTGIDGQFT